MLLVILEFELLLLETIERRERWERGERIYFYLSMGYETGEREKNKESFELLWILDV